MTEELRLYVDHCRWLYKMESDWYLTFIDNKSKSNSLDARDFCAFVNYWLKERNIQATADPSERFSVTYLEFASVEDKLLFELRYSN